MAVRAPDPSSPGGTRDDNVGGEADRLGDAVRLAMAVEQERTEALARPVPPRSRRERVVPPIHVRAALHGAGEGGAGIAEAEDEQTDRLAHVSPGRLRCLILRPAAESAISVASRLALVSARLALITHQIAGRR